MALKGYFRWICIVNHRLAFIEFRIFIYLLCFQMKQPRTMKIAIPKINMMTSKASNKLIFCKEAYLIVKIKSSGKNIQSSIFFFFPKLYRNQTHLELIDDKFLYGTVD